MHTRTSKALTLAAAVTAGVAHAQIEPEQLVVEELPERSPHWVYVTDISFFHMPDSKVVLLNGDAETTNEAYLGMMSTGYNPGIAVAPDGSEIYSAETWYSRGTRGEREDIVTVFDARTLEPVDEIDLPEKRHFSVTQPQGTVTANGGDDLLVFNVTPATSVSIVDLEAREFLGEISLPGCAFMYPAPEGRHFGTLCADGAFMTVSYDDEGQEVARSRQGLFDPDNAQIYEKPVYVGETLYFVSFTGTVHPVDWSGGEASLGETWQLASEAEREESWRPGGWMLEAAHSPTGRLFTLMHRGGAGTHKDPGTEVWVYDADAGERTARWTLENPAISILVTADDDPLMFAIRADFAVDVYDAGSGEYLRSFQGIADTPFLMRRP